MAEVYVFFADGFEEIEGLTVVDLSAQGQSAGAYGFHSGKTGKRLPWDCD